MLLGPVQNSRRRGKLVEDRFRYADPMKIYNDPGSVITGDHILIYCRKNSKWESNVRAADGHHYFKTNARMNASAVLVRKFKNLQK